MLDRLIKIECVRKDIFDINLKFPNLHSLGEMSTVELIHGVVFDSKVLQMYHIRILLENAFVVSRLNFKHEKK